MFNLRNAFLLSFAVSVIACLPKKEVDNNASIWITTLDKKMLLKQVEVEQIKNVKPTHTITIDTTKTYQEMEGFGYTLTGGSAMLLHKMSDKVRASIIQELFGNKENNI